MEIEIESKKWFDNLRHDCFSCWQINCENKNLLLYGEIYCNIIEKNKDIVDRHCSEKNCLLINDFEKYFKNELLKLKLEIEKYLVKKT